MQTNPELITTFTCTFFSFKTCYWRKQVWGSHFHIFGWREVFGEWILGEMWLENFNQEGKMSAGGHLHFRNVFDSSFAKRSALLFFQISVSSRDNYILLRIKCSLYLSALLQPQCFSSHLKSKWCTLALRQDSKFIEQFDFHQFFEDLCEDISKVIYFGEKSQKSTNILIYY